MLTKRLLPVFLVLVIILSSCASIDSVTLDQYIAHYQSVCRLLDINGQSDVIKEGEITVISAFNGLFSVGIACNGKDEMVYCSISTSELYGKNIKEEEEFKKAVLTASYLILPFFLDDYHEFDNENVAEAGGVIVASFDKDIELTRGVISSKYTEGNGFTITVIIK